MLCEQVGDGGQILRAFLAFPALEDIGAVFLEMQVQYLAAILVQIRGTIGIFKAQCLQLIEQALRRLLGIGGEKYTEGLAGWLGGDIDVIDAGCLAA